MSRDKISRCHPSRAPGLAPVREPRSPVRYQILFVFDRNGSHRKAVCSVCNEGARNLTLDRPSYQKLVIQVRRATGADQLEVLKWLLAKFPRQGAGMLGKEE